MLDSDMKNAIVVSKKIKRLHMRQWTPQKGASNGPTHRAVVPVGAPRGRYERASKWPAPARSSSHRRLPGREREDGEDVLRITPTGKEQPGAANCLT